MRSTQITVSIQRDDRWIDVETKYFAGTPGRYYGPPEDCYPGEDCEVDIVSAKFRDTGEDAGELTDDEYDTVKEKADEQAGDAYSAAMEDRDDSDREASDYDYERLENDYERSFGDS